MGCVSLGREKVWMGVEEEGCERGIKTSRIERRDLMTPDSCGLR